jgi:hypothetical protein
MANIAIQKERARLNAYYHDLTDGELQALAQEEQTLTEPAREALRDELSIRKLKVEPPQARVKSADSEAIQPAVTELVAVARFRDLPDMLVAKGLLESAGIESVSRDENTIRMDWFWSNALGGYKLCVTQEDRDAARQLIQDQFPSNLL